MPVHLSPETGTDLPDPHSLKVDNKEENEVKHSAMDGEDKIMSLLNKLNTTSDQS